MNLILDGKQLTECAWPGCQNKTFQSFCIDHTRESPFKQGMVLGLERIKKKNAKGDSRE